jgi:MFS transporter, DHA3 family, macrolide efflux protein
MQPPLPTIEKNAHTFRLYLIFWLGQLISLFGSTIVQFAFGWYLTTYSSNPAYMAVFMLVTFAPNIILSPIAGVVADKYSRKAIIIMADSFQAFITLVLIIMANWVPLSIVLLIGAMGIRYLGQAFHYPATNAVTATLVPDEKLSQMNGLGSMVSALIQIVAPLLGAVLITQFTLVQIFWVDVITFFIALLPLLFIKIPKVAAPDPALADSLVKTSRQKRKQHHYARDFAEGMRAVRETPGLGILILTAVFNNLFITPINVLSSYYILYDHGGNANTYAIVGIFIQAGIVVGSLYMSIKKKWKNRRFHFIIWHFIAFTGYLLVGIAPRGAFWMISLGGFIFLLGIPVINTLYVTYMQTAVPKEQQGRIFALDRALSSIASPIGMILAAPLGAWLGIGNLFSLCALISMAIITTFTLTGQMKKIKFDEYAEQAERLAEEVEREDATFPQTEPLNADEAALLTESV